MGALGMSRSAAALCRASAAVFCCADWRQGACTPLSRGSVPAPTRAVHAAHTGAAAGSVQERSIVEPIRNVLNGMVRGGVGFPQEQCGLNTPLLDCFPTRCLRLCGLA